MLPRHVHNFGTYFVTTQTWQRRTIFRNEELAKLMVEILLRDRSQGKYLLHDFVIMPDHLHFLFTPSGVALERAIQIIKGGYSYEGRQSGRPALEIWQPGYTDHRIRDAADYVRHVEYLQMNTVRANLCSLPFEYQFSSATGRYTLNDVPQRLKPFTNTAAMSHG